MATGARLRLGRACAATGCPGRGPFRVVLYNGYPGHGDPRHSRIPHIHLSWQHAPAQPFTPAAWVRALTPAQRFDNDPARLGRREVTHADAVR